MSYENEIILMDDMSARQEVIAALIKWAVEKNYTPYIVADKDRKGVEIPEYLMENEGEIYLNISPPAVKNIEFDDGNISFIAFFKDQKHSIVLPIGSITKILIKETRQSMIFNSIESNWAGDDPGLRVV